MLALGNVLGVVCQQVLTADCSRLLRINGYCASGLRECSNESKRHVDQDFDVEAINNLKRLLVENCQCTAVLWRLGPLVMGFLAPNDVVVEQKLQVL